MILDSVHSFAGCEIKYSARNAAGGEAGPSSRAEAAYVRVRLQVANSTGSLRLAFIELTAQYCTVHCTSTTKRRSGRCTACRLVSSTRLVHTIFRYSRESWASRAIRFEQSWIHDSSHLSKSMCTLYSVYYACSTTVQNIIVYVLYSTRAFQISG